MELLYSFLYLSETVIYKIVDLKERFLVHPAYFNLPPWWNSVTCKNLGQMALTKKRRKLQIVLGQSQKLTKFIPIHGNLKTFALVCVATTFLFVPLRSLRFWYEVNILSKGCQQTEICGRFYLRFTIQNKNYWL